jgi:hemolysin D
MRWADAIRLRRDEGARTREELAFLPAALEIVETPPSPIGRSIVWALVALFFLALAWSWWGTVDIVASASGKTVASGRSKVVQPFETGVVRAIHVRDGQSVKAGALLIELDPTINEAERLRLENELFALRLDAARLRAALADSSDQSFDVSALPEGLNRALVDVQRQYLQNQLSEHRAKIAAIDRQRMQKEAEADAIGATIGKLELTIPLIQQRVDARKELLDQGLTSRLTYLENMQQLVDQQQEMNVQKHRLQEARAALAAVIQSRAQAVAEFRRTLSSELSTAEQKSAASAQELIKIDKRSRLQALTAPVDGMVQQLSIHSVGGVVTPAQVLMVVVPADAGLEIEAMVSNRDIGFVHEGQRAEVKVDAFNFTRYGLLVGRVVSVSRDSITRDRPPERPADKPVGAEPSSEPKGQEMNFAAHITLDRAAIQVEDRLVNLTPGMAVTVEIKTGSRSVLSFLLSPLARYRQAAFRER